MKKLRYIEDYILAMGDHVLAWPPKPPIINLARYDVSVVDSMCIQIQQGNGFTDRQAVLAHKIVCKYQRQWTTAGYDVEHVRVNAEFRLPIRTVDRTKQIQISDNTIKIRFPYDQEIISEIRSTISEIPGDLFFDRDQRCWSAACIEPRLLWAKRFGDKYNFDYGQDFVMALQEIDQCQGYVIELRPTDQGYEIANAADSLVEYIQDKCGGFGLDNRLRLIDLAGVLGYSVNPECYDQLELEPTTRQMLTNRDVNIEYSVGSIDLAPVIEYAQLTQRWPIYVYESGTLTMRRQISKFFTEDEIVDRKINPQAKGHGRVVYFNHWRLADTHLPLLVTTHTLMIGSRRQQMLQCAEKIVYYTQKIEDEQLPISDT